ncbi:MAG: glycosyltransferase family 2 protein [Deltaproteobacteria bacterium]|nr:glycosyltransferase family 2 protein [Deltaproteobacteria bacterium]
MSVVATKFCSSKRPLVSILIPCWGCRAFVAEAIHSALAQNYEAIEVIVVEDCGSDGTYEEALKIRDPRLRVYRNERNLGQYGNKNRALQYARSDFIKILDGDDLLEPHAVSVLMDAWQAAGPGTGVVFGQFVSIDEGGNRVSRPRRWGIQGRCKGMDVLDLVTRKEWAASMFGNVSPHLFFRPALQAIGGFPDNNAGPGDIDAFLRLLSVTDVCFTEEAVARYRRHPGGMSGRTFGVRECADYVEMVERLSRYFERQEPVPAHLRDQVFLRHWKVWASTHIIMASLQRKLRRLPNQFDAIRNLFAEKGLSKEFDRMIWRRFPAFVYASLAAKARKSLGMPVHPDLFSRGEARRLRQGFQIESDRPDLQGAGGGQS